MLVLFAIDLEHQLLPNVITLPGIVLGLAFALVGPPGWRAAVAGVIVGGGLLYATAAGYYYVRKEDGLGMGDVKMLAMIGAFLGWQQMLLTLVLASFAGALVGVALIALQRGTMKYALPFGTFLAVGALAAMLVGQPVIDWYLGFDRGGPAAEPRRRRFRQPVPPPPSQLLHCRQRRRAHGA